MSEPAFTFHAHGMHCHGCEHIIEVSVRKLPGIVSVKADFPTETVTVAFDPAATGLDNIRATIERSGYRTYELDDPARRLSPLKKLVGLLFALAGILLIILFDTEWISRGGEPDISQHMSVGLIFMLGLLTGFHCVGMCGGFVLSYTADDASEERRSYLSHLLYGAGKTVSYTLIGSVFGLLGAFVAFTPLLRGVAGIFAGLFLIVFGLNMLGMFAPLRRFRLGLPAALQTFIHEKQARSRHRPFVIGLLNGLMIACGPLQAMYVMAAGTGSALEGAKMLFAFGVGTLPVLLSFGVLATLISGSLTHNLLKASGVIVVVLGAVMINRGLLLTGSGYDLRSIIFAHEGRSSFFESATPLGARKEPEAPTLAPQAGSLALSEAHPTFQIIRMDVIRSGYTPNHFRLIRGVPVKWIINGKQVTTCNRRISVPSLELEFDVKMGFQTIEFTPEKVGLIAWSCWMGMLHGEFDVVDAVPVQTAASEVKIPTEPEERADRAVPPSPPTHLESYTIVSGDALSRVAKRLYGEAGRWRDIAAANPGLNLRRLRPGLVIKLPQPVTR